jgi:hypothetical protein
MITTDDYDDDYSEDADGDRGPTEKELTQEIDKLLSALRPERYDPTDKTWLAPIVAHIAAMLRARLTVEQIVEDDARKRVYRREDSATRRVNKILSDIAKDGQLPLGWGTPPWKEVFGEVLALPVAINREKGGKRVGRIRIQFGALSLLDAVEFENAFRRDLQRDATARSQVADGAVVIRELMEDHNLERLDAYRRGDWDEENDEDPDWT